ncbi:3-phosphoshikimate 1-carboxyvinyltransferase [Taibaiella koreensis]|uniref:3-phosphoshikimate 1-carboxyvinyltransferase n=1 Tax=Taibaiella koreensis TaxID=1268548 RepID=UPI000E59A794|nr:3-phosphoshikimate 1-carboxyvinyltransferase [Taibaiella koreensis]
MQVRIHPSAVKGTLTAPASKSVMQRACAAALLRGGQTEIHNYGRSDDDKAALRIIQALGATVTHLDEQRLRIESPGRVAVPAGILLDCGESGLSMRMFSAIAALYPGTITLTGSGSLLTRPLAFLKEVLEALGATVQLTGDTLPIHITGPMQPQDITVDGSLTSQFLTGLLFAFSAIAHQGATIRVEQLKSRPYIDLSLKVMAEFGMRLPVQEDYASFHFPETDVLPEPPPLSYTVEGDWSNAAFLFVAGALAGNVVVEGLDVFSEQADKKILEALQDCGCRLSIQADQIEVTQHGLNAFHFDATECPDLFPPLVALAAYCKGTSVIEGVHRLEHKESNRAHSLQQEGQKLGVAITVQDDKMIIKGGNPLAGAMVQSHHDHRIAMACAIMALGAGGPVTIIHAEAVKKSYPGFWEHLSLLTQQAIVYLPYKNDVTI